MSCRNQERDKETKRTTITKQLTNQMTSKITPDWRVERSVLARIAAYYTVQHIELLTKLPVN